MYRLYKPAISVYFFFIRIAALFRSDAKKWVDGRIGWKEKLQEFVRSIEHRNSHRIWIHASSLGEFEQGRELIEIIKTNHPDKIIILSFFSPSGFDKCKNYSSADYVCYFPSDKFHEIKFFIQTLKPSLVFFIKYDFWFNTLELLIRNNIPFCFISTIFRKNHFLFNPLFGDLLNKLKHANQIFVQNQESYQLLKSRNFNNIQITGDTRLDRVYRIASEHNSVPNLELFCDRERIFIAGSVWDQDVNVISNSVTKAIHDGWKVILVPHVTDETTIKQIEIKFPDQTVRYSKLKHQASQPILIMDQIGFLSRMYKYCLFAYIGGGFGKGIHNILEPVAHKKAVCFGPNYRKFQEATDFIKLGIAHVIHDEHDMENAFRTIPAKQSQSIKIIDSYFQKNLGASKRIYDYLISGRLLN
jgi:3-deoxy-D-manno-octulosonic-acid transferase